MLFRSFGCKINSGQEKYFHTASILLPRIPLARDYCVTSLTLRHPSPSSGKPLRLPVSHLLRSVLSSPLYISHSLKPRIRPFSAHSGTSTMAFDVGHSLARTNCTPSNPQPTQNHQNLFQRHPAPRTAHESSDRQISDIGKCNCGTDATR